MKKSTKRLTFLGIFSSLALILSYIEFLIPPIYSAVPGIKLGLPNIIIIFALYKFSYKEAAVISLVRLIISALLFGNAMTFIYSFSGAALSLVVMAILKKTDKFSKIAISITGAISHNLGQIIAAMLLLKTNEIFYYMIVLTFTGILAGIAIGLIANVVLKRFNWLEV
ncbi:MAG: Gx transporter family protein [Clostridia bacterium]|nr:Gx transporter family protein [Clostridia bacterium]